MYGIGTYRTDSSIYLKWFSLLLDIKWDRISDGASRQNNQGMEVEGAKKILGNYSNDITKIIIYVTYPQL